MCALHTLVDAAASAAAAAAAVRISTCLYNA